MGKRAENMQRAAHEAHLREQEAIDQGDIIGAIVEAEESADLALAAMLLRMRGE